MNDFLIMAAQNTVAAGVLAVFVCAVTRVWRHPKVAHVLWLLVLAKLIGPPIVPVDWLGFGSNKPAVESRDVDRDVAADSPRALTSLADPAASRREADHLNASREPDPATAFADEPAAHWLPGALFETACDYFWLYWNQSKAGIFFAWMAGLVLCSSIALHRVLRFDRMLQGTLCAPQRLQVIAAQLAQKLALRRVPDLRLVDGCMGPLVWCFGRRPVIVLPTRLIHELDDHETSLVIAHELAHLRRHDHWTRGAEIVISAVYWWNPLVWWIRRQLHHVEELCCDAWVDWVYPDSKKCYAEVLFKAATLTGGARRAPSPACSFLSAGTLKNRIEAVLEGRLSRRVSRKTALALGAVGALLLPSFALSVRPADAPSSPPTGSNAADSKTRPEFRGKVVGTVTVEGTDEPVQGATITATLGGITGREYNSVAAKTDANGRYSIDVPLGNAGLWPWTFRLPAGYWTTDRRANVVTSAAAPVATKDYALRRGPVWQVRVRERTSGKPIPAIQCTVTPLQGTPQMTVAFTNSDGIAQATLPGFHGRFQLVVFDVNHRGRFELASAPLAIDSGFHFDRVTHITPGKQAGAFELRDKQGKTATLQGARATLASGKVLIDVDLMPTVTEGVGVVRGIVADQSGQPLAGAQVETAQANESGTGFITGMAATTGTDGRFEIANAGVRAGGQVALVVTKAGYGGIETPPQAIPENREEPIDFGRITLLPGKSLRVRVLDAAGKPAVGAWVEPRGGYAVIVESGATDERGECLLRNLPAGVVKVFATFGNSYGNGAALAADVPATITLRLKPVPKRGAAAEPSQPRPLELGTPAPDLSVAGWADGKARSLADYRGKVVFLDFWGIWCGPCVRMLPMIKDLEAKYKGRDVAFLTVHTPGTEMEQIREFQRQMKFGFVTALDAGDDDGATSKAYAVRGYPTVFIIGRDGRIAWSNDRIPPTDRMQNMKRAAHALSIPWPINEKQPKENLAAQMNRIREYLFREAIDRVLTNH